MKILHKFFWLSVTQESTQRFTEKVKKKNDSNWIFFSQFSINFEFKFLCVAAVVGNVRKDEMNNRIKYRSGKLIEILLILYIFHSARNVSYSSILSKSFFYSLNLPPPSHDQIRDFLMTLKSNIISLAPHEITVCNFISFSHLSPFSEP